MPGILIGGGSLAGMACAIRLKQLGHDPVTFEKSQFPRKKLCGEFLGPDAFPLLQTLGIFETVAGHAYGPIEKTHFFNQAGQPLTIHHRWIHRQWPYALAIPRETLDTLLLRHAQALGLQIHEKSRVISPLKMEHGAFQVQVEHQRPNQPLTTHHYAADILIDATGRNGGMALNDPPPCPRTVKKQVGIQCHIRMQEEFPTPDLSMFLFSGGYGGIQPISSHTANLCMLLDAVQARTMHDSFPCFIDATIGQNPAARAYLTHAQQDGDFCTTANINLPQAGGMLRQPEGSPHALIRIGDAQITVDPFTGSGMAHALETGIMAAEIVHEGIRRQQHYQTIHAKYHVEYKRRFLTRLRLMNTFRPCLERPEWQHVLWPLLPPFLPLFARIFR